MLTSDVENFPGYREAISGPSMMEGTINSYQLMTKYFTIFS